MRRHFYLIIIIFLYISGTSVSYSQTQNAEPVKSNEIEKSSDVKSGENLSTGNRDSQKKIDSSVKNSVEKSDKQGVPDAPDEKAAVKEKTGIAESQKKSLDTEEKTKKAEKPEIAGVNENVQAVQTPSRVKSDTLLFKRLLEVNDEDYRYNRIPGYKKEKVLDHFEQPVIKVDSELTDSADSTSESDRKDTEKGLWGLSKSTSDLLTKGSLILLILVIFILYRLRSRGNSRTVLRRYPKR